MKMVREFVDNEGNGRSERKRLLLFLKIGDDNDYADDDCNGNNNGND